MAVQVMSLQGLGWRSELGELFVIAMPAVLSLLVHLLVYAI